MDKLIIDAVWEKALVVEGYNPSILRKDCVGAWIMKQEYGNTDSLYGWEIDHIYPIARGGGDDMINLRPMQWQNNIAKGKDFPVYQTAVKADGNRNISSVRQLRVNDKLRVELEQLYK